MLSLVMLSGAEVGEMVITQAVEGEVDMEDGNNYLCLHCLPYALIKTILAMLTACLSWSAPPSCSVTTCSSVLQRGLDHAQNREAEFDSLVLYSFFLLGLVLPLPATDRRLQLKASQHPYVYVSS